MSSPSGESYRGVSLWWDGLPGPITVRPGLPGDTEVDVAIVGGGLTGLWTAYYLAGADPSLRIAVLERDVAGFGASGRNGGWCSALFPVSETALDAQHGPGSGTKQRLAMEATVDEVGRVVDVEGIDCGFTKGGGVWLARTPAQLERDRAGVVGARARGIGPEDLDELDAAAAAARVGATNVLGGTWTPHVAAVDPARLTRGMADAVERRGVTVYEQTEVRSISPGRVATARGTVRATTIVRATEGYTRSLAGQRREIAPVYSLMIATEPLSDDIWAQIGMADREVFTDHRHMVIYGQRTEDGRLAFGGRGAPYHFGSAIRPEFDRDERVHDDLHRTLIDLFPILATTRITHRWGGPLGITRDWNASVGIDSTTRLAWAGGYVGDGLSTTNLAGRTLCDLILGRDSELTTLPWVNHRSRRWEPEPARWLGVNVGLYMAGVADRTEDGGGSEPLAAKALRRLTGGG